MAARPWSAALAAFGAGLALANLAAGDPGREPHGPLAQPVRFRSGPIELTGEVFSPEGPAPRGCVILLPGSGPVRIGDAGPGRELYRGLESAILAAGLSVLEYDKRGVGGSGGDFASASIQDNARDALAAVRLIAERFRGPGAAPLIGIAGHSEGGLIASEAVRLEPSRIRFVVLICSPVVDGPEFIEEQQRMREERAGYAPGRVAVDLRYIGAMVSILGSEPDDILASAAIWRAYRQCYPEEFSPEGSADAVRVSQAFLQIRAFESPWVRSLIRSRPMSGLARFRGAVFAVWSRDDEQVEAASNGNRFGLRTVAGDEVVMAGGLDHFLRPAGIPGDAGEWPRVRERLLRWLRREASAGSPP